MKRSYLITTATGALVAAFLLHGCGKNEERTGTEAAGKKAVMIVAPRDFRDEELFDVKSALEAAGATVRVASTSLDEATGMLGGKVKPDLLVSDIEVAEFDAVIFVGGKGARVYWDDPTAHHIASLTDKYGKILGAICFAPVTLAKAGVLDSRKATVWSSEKGALEAMGAQYTGADVEVDGEIITANGPKASKKFAEAIIKALAAQSD
jgi:protease I